MKSIYLRNLIIGGTFIFNSVLAQVPSYVPSNGLKVWLGFNGNSNDLSGNGNNATNTGATFVADRNGNPASAASFNGTSSNYMQITTPTFTHSPTGAFSYSLWMNKQTQTTAAGIVLMSGTSTTGVFITLIQGASNFTFGTNKQQSAWVNLSCAHTLNVWDHYVTTYNNGIMKVYKNGVFQATITNSQTGATTATNPFYIARGLNTSNTYKGALDDIGVWDRELSQTEITALFTGITEVPEINANAEVVIYPNPARDAIQLKVNASQIGQSYRTVDESGRIMIAGKITSENNRIDIHALADGIYFIEPEGSIEWRYKFIKSEK